MGYAIFAARKLSLTNRLNQLNFRIMQLSQQQMTLSQAAGDMERVLSAQKNYMNNVNNAMLNNLFNMNGQNGSGGATNNIFQQAMQQIQQTYLQNSMMDLLAGNKMQEVKNIETQIELERKTLETQAKAVETELKQVEEAENKAIERSAPKFA